MNNKKKTKQTDVYSLSHRYINNNVFIIDMNANHCVTTFECMHLKICLYIEQG